MKPQHIVTILTPLITITFLVFTIYWFLARDQVIRAKLERKINDEIIKGNEYAIKIYKCHYVIRFDNKKLILEALNGNEYALKALGIEVERKRD